VAGNRKISAFPSFIFYWQRDCSHLSKLFITWGLQLQTENISGSFTFRWFPKSCWVFISIKILKNNLNNFFSSISSCILPTWILCSHFEVKSPDLAALQSVVHAKITRYCFISAGQECIWARHTTEAWSQIITLAVSVA